MKHLIRIIVALMLAVSFGPLQAQAFSGGFVDGVVTLAKTNSPYTFTQTIQISRGSTLRVEPGVVIKIKHEGVAFKSAGTVELLGTATEKIRIESAVTLFETAGDFASKANFKATFVEALGIGSIFTTLNQGQNIDFKDSVFIADASQAKPMFNWLTFCTQCTFERNVFQGLPGFETQTYSGGGEKVVFTNNLFIGNSSSLSSSFNPDRAGVWITTEGNISLSGNSFIKFSKPVLQRQGGTSAMVLDGNYFNGLGAADVSKIAVRDLSNFPISLNSPLTTPSPLTPLEPNLIVPTRKDFGWKFKGSTLEVRTTKLASAGDVIQVSVGGKEYSTVVYSSNNQITLKFEGVTLSGARTTRIQISSLLFKNDLPLNQKFSSCQAMWTFFDGGIAKASNSKNKGVKTKKKATVYSVGYAANSSLDKDRDGLVCER
jgi:hypothetical protein